MELALTAERDAGASGKPADDLRRALESLQEDVLAMERRAAEASYFLPPYDSRATTSAVDKLKSAVATAIADLLPRKKFSFASRKKRARRRESRGGLEPRAPDPEAPESSKPCDVSDTSSAAAVMAKVAAMTAAAEDGPGLRDVAGGPPRVIRAPVKGADATLENLADVDVFLLGTFRALRCHNLRRVRVYGGPIAGSAHVQRLEGCHVEIAARQVRVHDAFRRNAVSRADALSANHRALLGPWLRAVRVRVPRRGGGARGGVGGGDGCVAGRGRFRVDQEAAVAELAHHPGRRARRAAETTRRGRDEGRDERVALLDYPIIFEDYVSRIRDSRRT